MRAGPDKGAGGFFPHGIGCTILRLERPMWTTLQKCNNAIPVPARCPAPFLTVPDGNGAASTFHSTAATLCNVSGNGIVAENPVFQDISISPNSIADNIRIWPCRLVCQNQEISRSQFLSRPDPPHRTKANSPCISASPQAPAAWAKRTR